MIEFKNVCKKYDNSLVLDNISFKLPNKGIVYLKGKSGSGKSTILNLIAKRCDHIFYIDQEVENGKPVRYLYTRDCEHHMAGSRVAKLPSKILLDANKIQEEIKKAVNSEEHTTNEEVKPIVKEEVNFDELKEEVTEIVMTYFHPNDLMNEVTKITDEVLGLSVKVNDLTPMQSDALEIVKLKLEEKAEELGLK